MSNWFEGSNHIACTLADIVTSLEDLGTHYMGVVALMPGLSKVELVEQGSDFVTLRTNEGVMKRTNIAVDYGPDNIRIELDEVYEAGAAITATSHFVDEFTSTADGVLHFTTISAVLAPGFLGFFYRKLGSASIGNAYLRAYEAFFKTS